MKQPVSQLTVGYPALLEDLKARIRSARQKAALSVNRELILLHWELGRRILESQSQEGWGAKVIDRLAADLQREFPDAKGFSPRNLKYMRALAEAWPDEAFVQGPLAQITWYHHITLLEKVKDRPEREFYIRQTIANGWSRAVLVHQIESGLFHRQGKALNNFDLVLPPAQSDLARETLKDPYVFDFLGLGPEAQERDLERVLVSQVREFLLELGAGFALIGTQYRLEVGGQEFYLDLLFYHVRLRCYVVVELKVGEFQPEHAGKMLFYLAAVDDLLRHPDDQPSIGLILCKVQNRLVAEYTLRGAQRPLGVATYQMMPEPLRDALPSPAEIEAVLALPPAGAAPS